MFWYVRRLFNQGVLIPRHTFAQQEELLASFSLCEVRDEVTSRTAPVATLTAHPHYPVKMPPPLFDATVIHASGGVWTVTGIERESTSLSTMKWVTQSWYMRPVPAKEELELEDRFKREFLARLPAHIRPK